MGAAGGGRTHHWLGRCAGQGLPFRRLRRPHDTRRAAVIATTMVTMVTTNPTTTTFTITTSTTVSTGATITITTATAHLIGWCAVLVSQGGFVLCGLLCSGRRLRAWLVWFGEKRTWRRIKRCWRRWRRLQPWR